MRNILSNKLFLIAFVLLTSCEEGYKKSFFGKISFNKKEINVQDKKSFEILNHNYAKDNTRAYYRGFEIENSDGKSFVLLERNYSKDKNQVYWCVNYLDGTKYYTQRATDIHILEGEKPSQFVIIDEYFAKGNLHAYSGYIQLMNSHGPSFKSLGGGYGKDRDNVYHEYNIMGAHAKSFNLIVYPYAKDKNSIYYEGLELYGVDVSTFEILYSIVSKDEKYIYNGYEKIEGIDAETYHFFKESPYAKDKQSIYWMTTKIPEADLQSFIANKGSLYAKDKNNYYDQELIVKNGDYGYEEAVEEYK